MMIWQRLQATWTRLLLIVGVLALAGGLAVFALRPAAVSIAEVVRRDITPAVQGVGTVEAKVVVQISSKITGRIVAVLVDQGDVVEVGQVLVRLDEAQLRADVQRSEAAVRAAEAQLRDLLAGSRPEEIAEARANLARAEAQLNDLLAGSRAPEIEELQQRVQSASATRVLAERELKRIEQLHARELVAAQEHDRARQAHDVAVAQERAAQQALRLAIEGARKDQIAAARHQVDATRRRLDLLLAGARPEQVAEARARTQEARAALALARERLADTIIASPVNAYVVSRELEPGATVNPGTPILKIADPRTAWVTVHVDERDTGGVTVGDPAEVVLRSLSGRTLRGHVARIQRESDRVTEQLAVDVALDERPPRLVLGEQAEALIRQSAVPGALVIPLAAVVRRPEGLGALAVTDGRLHFRTVRFGAADPGGWIQVLDGLRAGEHVVVAPGRMAEPAHEGRRVRAPAVDTAASVGR
jgi:HlyD family secretion protein